VNAGSKLAALALTGTALVLIDDVRLLAASPFPVLLAAIVARVPRRTLFQGWRAALIVILLAAGARAAFDGWEPGLAVGARLATLLLAARLLSATTTATELLDATTTALRPFERLGINAEAVALAFSLAFRFIPLLAEAVEEIRDAQRARGLDRSPIALLSPLLARVMAIGDAVADAIDARSGSPSREFHKKT